MTQRAGRTCVKSMRRLPVINIKKLPCALELRSMLQARKKHFQLDLRGGTDRDGKAGG